MKRALSAVCIAGLLVAAGARGAVCATKPFEKVEAHGQNLTNFPRGVRGIGMGAAGVSEVLGYNTGFFNPASLAWADAIVANASHNDWILDEAFGDVRVVGGFPQGPERAVDGWRFGGSIAYS